MAAPKIIPYNVELRSVNPVRSFDRPKAYTNDLNSVEFQFKILDMTSTELSTATAVTLVYMRDGSFFANPSTDVSRVGNVFSYLLKENEGNHAGVAQIQLVVTVDGMELASQLFDFEIINGLETKVAQEVMIYDWTTLTRDAQDYIDQFVSNEATRQQQFTDAQTERTNTFNQSEADRTTAFTASEDARTVTFNGSEASRTTAFNTAEDGRATAEIGRVTAESNRVTAETNRTTSESNRVTAETNRATAESGRVTAESGRVTAESARATTFAGYDSRIVDMETDVNFDGTNRIPNGDFASGTSGFSPLNGTLSAANNELTFTINSLSSSAGVYKTLDVGILPTNNVYYISAQVFPKFNNMMDIGFTSGEGRKSINNIVANAWNKISVVAKKTIETPSIIFYQYVNTNYVIGDVIKFKYLQTIDLTATFGKGNEPTAEQMDALLAKFPNSWFDGTASLFQSKLGLTKQLALDARTEFDAKNAVVNGDLSDGTTGWTAQGGSISNVNGECNFTVSDLLTFSGIRQGIPTTTVNNKYYLSGKIKPKYDSLTRLIIGTDTASFYPTPNVWSRVSAVLTATSSSTLFEFKHSTATGYVVGDIVYFDNITLIDVTAVFGAGKEPTLAEMDRLMARFPNSWFDGVKPIQTIETLYQEKANKVQEAWITPTLANAWTEVSGSPVRYMKDEMGFVHFKGRLSGVTSGTLAFTLPVGYRPLESLYRVVPYGSGSSVLPKHVYVNTGGGVYPYAVDSLDISAITPFRAEG